MKIFKIFANQYFWLALIVILGLITRLYKLDSPIADWHSWRQADTAAVTRNFIKLGFTPFFPKYDDLSGVAEKPVINPAGFRFVEFPVYNIAVYPLYLLFGIDDRYHRLVSIFFSLGSTTLLFFIVKKYSGIVAGLMTAFTFAVLPFNIFFSRTTLPEPTFIFFALGMIFFVDRWIWPACNASRSDAGREEKRGSAILGFIFTSIAFLTKPWAIFFFLPLIYSLYFNHKGKKFWIKFFLYTFLSLIPFILWRLWILQQPEGIPASNWLFNGDGIRFRPAFWWWIISERMGREILGATGMVLFFIGFIVRPRNGNYFLHFWALCSFLFMAVVATGSVRHNYYQIQFIPVASIFVALGFIHLLKGNRAFIPRVWTIFLGLFLLPLAFYFGYKVTKDFYNINNPSIVEAGRAADKILPKDAIVLAPYNGDTAFLYQINRQGFAAEALPIPELITDFGVGYYISTTKDDKTSWVMRHFEVLADNPHFIIANLTNLVKPLDNTDPEP